MPSRVNSRQVFVSSSLAQRVTSAASLAAQTGPTAFVTTDANGNLAAVANLNTELTQLSGQVLANQREARQGIAMAFAGVNASMPSAPERTSWAVNAATYKGQSALAGGLAYRLDVAMPLAVAAGIAIGVRSSVAIKGGLQGEF